MVAIRDFLGLVENRRRFAPGEAKVCQNFLINRVEGGQSRAEVRSLLTKYEATRAAASGALSLFEHRQNDGAYRELLKLANGTLYESVGGGGAWASVKTGLSTLTMEFCRGFDKTYFVDGDNDGNFMYNGSSVRDLVKSAPGGSLAPTEAGAAAATGFGLGTFEYTFSDYDPTDGWESVPRATQTVVKANANTGVVLSDPGTYTAPYTRKRIYRRLRGTNQWYLVHTKATGDFPFSDTVLESALLPSALSEVHDNETGIMDMEVPAAGVSCVFYRGRLFLARDDTVLWSKVGLPFLFRISGEARKEIGDDGDPVTALRVFGESLVVFKQNSIWVLNGDVEESGFVFYPASRWVGCISRNSCVVTSEGIVFFDMQMVPWMFDLTPQSIREPVGNVIDVWNSFSADLGVTARYSYWGCGYYAEERAAVFNFVDGNDAYGDPYVFFLDGRVWSKLSSGGMKWTCFAELTLGDAPGGARCFYIGNGSGQTFYIPPDTLGNDPVGDGIMSGTVSGTATGGAATTVTVGAAAFKTTEDSLIGRNVTVVRASDGTIQHALIVSNTGTVITVASWPTFTPASGDTVYVGAIHAILHLGEYDLGSPQAKRLNRVYFMHEEVNHSWRLGCQKDDDSSRSNYVTRNLNNKFRSRFNVSRRGYKFSPFVEGVHPTLALDLQEIHFEPKEVRGVI